MEIKSDEYKLEEFAHRIQILTNRINLEIKP